MNGMSLTISNLSVAYGSRQIIENLDLAELPPGNVVALVGPNAAGKSTLLRALAGLVPASGRIMLGRRDLLAISRMERSGLVGFMPQNLPSGVGLSVMETVIAALRIAAPQHGEQMLGRRAVGVLERLGIIDIALEPLDRLSGGQRQICALAQALAGDPALLLLDEPTSALDLSHQFQVMRTVCEVARSGRTVVVILHDLALAAKWADSVVVLKRGGLYTQGAPVDAITSAMLADVYAIAADTVALPSGALGIDVKGLARQAGEAGEDR